MTDYTDLKARLAGDVHLHEAAGNGELPRIQNTREAAAAIDALEADIARLQTAHVQMQRAHDDLAAENARLRDGVAWISRRIPPTTPPAEMLNPAWIRDSEAREVAHDVIACARAALTAPKGE